MTNAEEISLNHIFKETGFRLVENKGGMNQAVYRNPLSKQKSGQIVIAVYGGDVLTITFYPKALHDVELFLYRFRNWLKITRRIECRISYDTKNPAEMEKKARKIADKLKTSLYPEKFFMESFVPDYFVDKMYIDFSKDLSETKEDETEEIDDFYVP